MPLAPKLRAQQAHHTLINTGKQLPNTLALWYFRVTPHHKCMNSSCKKARHHGYKEIATRAGQSRLRRNQTAPTLLKEMTKSYLFTLPNNGAHASPAIFCSPTAEHLLTGSTNYPSLLFREPYLKLGIGDILLPQEPSMGHHATGMVGNASQLLKEHHWKHTTKDCKVWITPRQGTSHAHQDT